MNPRLKNLVIRFLPAYSPPAVFDAQGNVVVSALHLSMIALIDNSFQHCVPCVLSNQQKNCQFILYGTPCNRCTEEDLDDICDFAITAERHDCVRELVQSIVPAENYEGDLQRSILFFMNLIPFNSLEMTRDINHLRSGRVAFEATNEYIAVLEDMLKKLRESRRRHQLSAHTNWISFLNRFDSISFPADDPRQRFRAVLRRRLPVLPPGHTSNPMSDPISIIIHLLVSNTQIVKLSWIPTKRRRKWAFLQRWSSAGRRSIVTAEVLARNASYHCRTPLLFFNKEIPMILSPACPKNM